MTTATLDRPRVRPLAIEPQAGLARIKGGERGVVTRFAPSPTGALHIGGARTALFNYLFTRQNNGKYILRIEDTDRERSKKEYEEDILAGLHWLGIQEDEFYRQSERGEIYKKYLEQLIDGGKAYVSQEIPGEEKTEVGPPKEGRPLKREEVIRLRNPGRVVKFNDLIRGEISFDTTELGDFVIAKSLDEPLYHFAVVVDDTEMGITHVIRGEDHISNTPRQILIQEAIGTARPTYAHIPLILAPDRSKLSKRHGAVSLAEFIKMGYLPEATINFLALLGWHPNSDQEIFNLEELIQKFDLKKVQKGGAIFDIEKLNWLNRQYIGRLAGDRQLEMAMEHLPEKVKRLPQFSEKRLKAALPVLIDRISFFDELSQSALAGELDYLFDQPKYEVGLLTQENTIDKMSTLNHLDKISDLLHLITDSEFSQETVKTAIWSYATKEGRNNVLWPMRVALTGLAKSPDPFTVASILGREETIKRLKYALAL